MLSARIVERMPPEQPMLLADSIWVETKDGDDTVRAIFDRHYSRQRYKDGRCSKLFVGPGQKMVLMTPDARAIFVWRKFKSDDGQQGINCAVFRRESGPKASLLIRAAMDLAWKRWPGERLYTYVDAKKIKSVNPGACFIKAGWKRCGITKWNKLIILEAKPDGPSREAKDGVAALRDRRRN